MCNEWFPGSSSNAGGALWNPTDFQFFAVSLTSGIVLAEFPNLQASKLSYRFGESTSETVMLPWHDIPSNWVEATVPYSVAVLLVNGSRVLWGGIVVKRERTLQGEGLTLTLVTVEHYFDSVYVKDHSYTGWEQTWIASNLVTSTLENHRFMLDVETASSGIHRDRTYEESSDKTLLSALQELSNVQNGPEWCTSWHVRDGKYVPLLTIADRIGSIEPATTFDESTMTSFRLLEDYSGGFGANLVVAVGNTTGEDQMRSDAMEDVQSYRPVVEYVICPSSSITSKETLNAHATSSLQQLRNGTNTVDMTLSLMTAPAVYADWRPGDVVAWTVSDDDGRFAGFDHGEARVVGYNIDFSGAWTITPVLR